jgi:hypothetical protein
LVTKRNDLLDNLLHRPLAAVQHGTDLNGCGLDDCHLNIPFVVDAKTRLGGAEAQMVVSASVSGMSYRA